MSGRSYHKAFRRYAHADFDANGPMSALNTFELRSNVQHAIDIASQVRVNWVASTSGNENEVEANNGETQHWAACFPLTITDALKAPKIGVRVATRGSSLSTGRVEVQVAPVDSGTPLFTHAWAISSDTAAWQTEHLEESLRWRRCARPLVYFDPSEAALAVTPFSYCQARLIVTLRNTTVASSSLYLSGVQLREYV